MQKLDDEQLEGSGFVFQEIKEDILEIYKVNDIQASSYIELPPKYKNSQSIINIKNDDQFCFLWCILAHLFPVEDHENRTSKYSMHFDKLNLKRLEFPMKVKDIPKFENLNNLNVNVFELPNSKNSVLTPIHINTNYDQPQTDLLLFENHYCLITKLHCLINKDSHMKWVCRRCLTAFSSEDILNQHIDRCQKQQPTNITFSGKDHLKFEDYHMKVPVPIRVYADFECNNQPTELRTDDPKGDREAAPNILFKQILIAVGFYIISPFGNQYYSYFGESCVTWVVNEMLTLEKVASNYFETDIPLDEGVASQESFQQSTICWLCENPLGEDTVRDHDHLTGKFRGAAHNRWNLKCKKSQVRLFPFFHNFSGYDCHLFLNTS